MHGQGAGEVIQKIKGLVGERINKLVAGSSDLRGHGCNFSAGKSTQNQSA